MEHKQPGSDTLEGSSCCIGVDHVRAGAGCASVIGQSVVNSDPLQASQLHSLLSLWQTDP